MSEENQLNPEEQAMEAALSQLRPAGVGFDAATVRLEARLRRMSRQVWMWRAAAAVLAVAAGVAGATAYRGVRQRPVATVEPAISTPTIAGTGVPVATISKDNYLAMRDRVLTVGLSALDAAAGKRESEPTRKEQATPSWNPFKQEQL